MSRGNLTNDELLAIHNSLPDLIPLQETIHHLSPEMIAMVFPPDSRVPEASVCLIDAVNVAVEARYAAHEARAHQVYYTSTVDPPSPMTAVFFGKFYLDDAALRLYAAGEHVASAIASMLEVDESALIPHREHRTSEQAVLWSYLKGEQPHHVVTNALRTLGEPWLETMNYRNLWVHTEPPRIEGQGIVFKRGNRWRGNPGSARYLAFNGGDVPDWTIEKLSVSVIAALQRFGEVLERIVGVYLEQLEASGFQRTPNGSRVQMFPGQRA